MGTIHKNIIISKITIITIKIIAMIIQTIKATTIIIEIIISIIIIIIGSGIYFFIHPGTNADIT